MKIAGSGVLLSIGLLFYTGFSHAQEKAIYGADDRLDYFEAPESMKKIADSVVSLWNMGDLDSFAAGTYTYRTVEFGSANNLCPDEKFSRQPQAAFCSGVLVGEDLVMTAGHCIDEARCPVTSFVFGFAQTDKDAPIKPGQSQFPALNVYNGCKRIVKRAFSNRPSLGNSNPQSYPEDYAVVQLFRKVEGRKPLEIKRSGAPVKTGDGVFMIGHPNGLPVKITGGGTVGFAGQDTHFFAVNLDGFTGNSGSPVFSAATGLIEGIFVRGPEDFTMTQAGCKKAVVYKQDLIASHVTKIIMTRDVIAPLPAPADAKQYPAPMGRQPSEAFRELVNELIF